MEKKKKVKEKEYKDVKAKEYKGGKSKKNKGVKSKKIKGGYGFITETVSTNISGPDNKEYLHWNDIPANTLVLLTANELKNVICEIVDSTPEWDGYRIYGKLYTLRDYHGIMHTVTSYDFRVLVIMKDAFGDTSYEKYHLGIIVGLYNNINMDSDIQSNILHVITLDDNDNSEIKNLFYNSKDDKDNNLRFMSSNDIEAQPTEDHPKPLKIYVSIFFNRIMKHRFKDSILSLYTINDRRNGWLLSTVQNKQDIDNIIASSQSQPNFGSVPQGFGSTPQPFGSVPQGFGSTPQPFGSVPQGFGSTPQPFGSVPPGFGSTPQPFGSVPPGFGSVPPGFGSTPPGFGSTPPGFGSANPGFQGFQGFQGFGSTPPPFGSVPQGFGQGFGADGDPASPPFGPKKGKKNYSTPPPFGSGFGSFDSASGQGPSPSPQNKPNDNIDAANAIIKQFFPNADYLIEDELTISENAKIDEYIKKQIRDKIESDILKFRTGYKKAVLYLHPDRKAKLPELFKEIFEKNEDKNIKEKALKESVHIVYTLLNAINLSVNSGGSKISLYKRVYKKEILGKNRVIYKVSGSNKEYVKSKGIYISVIEYKKSINKKP